MPNATKALRRRWARRRPAAARLRGNGGFARDETSSPVESSAMGQLIDLAEWRLLPPVDPSDDGAA
jgi:hypothetical protein